MTGGDLDVAQVNACVEHGRDKSVAEHMWVSPGYLDAGSLGELIQAAGDWVPVHPGTAAVEQDRSARAVSSCRVDAGGSGTRRSCSLAAHAQGPVAVFSPRLMMSAPVTSKIRGPSRLSMASGAKSYGFGDSRVSVSRGIERQVGEPEGGDSAETTGRRSRSGDT